MPVAPDPVVADIRSIRIEPAPVVELFWVLHDLALGKPHHEHPVFHDRGLAERAQAFASPSPNVCYGFDELLILSGANDLLTTTDVDGLIERMPELAQMPERPFALATETEETRLHSLAQLAALRGDAALRATFQALLRDAWDAIRETWETEAEAATERTSAALRARAAQTTDLADLIGPRHWVLEERFRPLLDAAMARREALIVPAYFGGQSLVYDLPGLFLVGIPAHTMPRAEQLRLMVQESATRLKVLADPTRMAMVAYLADCPATVTELARTFSIAQPTVSSHVRMLREAHLIHAVHADSKMRYEVSREELERLLSGVRQKILGSA